MGRQGRESGSVSGAEETDSNTVDRQSLNIYSPPLSFSLSLSLSLSLSPTCRKDVRLPQQLQRAMAAEAEAAREARAKVIAAEGEHQASRSLANAAEIITSSPAALQVSSFSPFPHCILQHCKLQPHCFREKRQFPRPAR